MRKTLLMAGIMLVLIAPAHADVQKFKSEDSAAKFCQTGNVVWYNPDSKIYFAPGSKFYGKTKAGGYTCKSLAEKAGFRASKEN